MKKFFITITVLIVIVLGLFSFLIVREHNNNSNLDNIEDINDLDDEEILGIESDEEIKEDNPNYSEEYREYLELTEEEKEKIDAIPRKENVPLTSLDKLEQKEEINEIPDSFDLRNVIDMEVENQGSYGLCWAFASNKVLETNLWLHEGEKYDLSEIQIDYVTSDLMYGSRQIHSGGSFDYFKDYFLISGATMEEDNEYREHSYSEYNGFLNRESVAIVTDTIDFPTINKGNVNYTDEELVKFRKVIKSHIMTNGAIYAGIGSPYLSNNNSYYCDNDCFKSGRHAVAIVGWDDNYAKENFMSATGNQPKENGAYIAINSWGSEWGEFGYFYISYEDMYVEHDMSGVISTSIDDTIKVSDIKNEYIKEVVIERLHYSFINYNGEDYVTKYAISKITSLDLSNKNLTSNDLKELSIFENLYFLNLSNNNIDDISNLSKLEKISYLDLSNNSINDVSSLKNLEYLVTLDLSNNKNVSGYGELTNLTSLTLKNCNIVNLEDLSNYVQLFSLDLSNNLNINIDKVLPKSLGMLVLSDCGLTKLDFLDNFNDLFSLDLSNNKLESLDGIEEINSPYLAKLDISGNSNINDYSKLKELEMINNLVVGNNNIEDISIFNDISLFELDLSYNNIKDVSSFNNKSIFRLNLSGNKNITGLESIKNVNVVILSDCNISNLDEVIMLENVNTLDLSNNNISDISSLNKLTNLKDLSLEGNKNLTGSLSNNIDSLNISNTGLKDFDISGLSNLSIINISNNEEFDVIGLIENRCYEHLNVYMDNVYISSEVIDILDSNYVTLNNPIIYFNMLLSDNERLDLSDNEWLEKFIIRNILTGNINIGNGILDKKANTIELIEREENITLEFLNYYYDGVLSPNIRIICN